jgi:cell division protein FtsN
MRNNETGEFELVVGNRQLLSGFFIVVLLFAVAFAMGYVVGQNSPRSGKLAEIPATNVSPPTGDARPQPLSPAATTPQPTTSPETPPAQPAADTGPQPSTQPAQGAAQPAETPAAPAAAASSTPGELPPGSYWQAMSVGQATAEAVQQTLKDKGFPVVLIAGPNNLTRVLVGPYSDNAALGRAKTDLENNGMHPVRYRPQQ